MPRISQVAYCCGRNYWRWRRPGRPFPAGHTECCHCRCKLQWKNSGGTNKVATLRYYYRQRLAHAEQGFNSRGRPYGRTPNLLPSQRDPHYHRANLAKYHRRAQCFAAQGLTSRGQPRRYNVLSPIEQAWRTFRAELNVAPAGDFLTPSERSEL